MRIESKTGVKGFEDLIAWQKARELTQAIYVETGKNEFSKDFGLSNQIRRASVSVMANLAEGFERATTKEFLRFLFIAKSSCGEIRSHLTIARDIGYLTEPNYLELKRRAIEVSRMLAGLCTSIGRKVEH